MPRTYRTKHKYQQYDKKSLEGAISAIKAGDQTPSSAARVFGIPRKTLVNRMRRPNVSCPGGSTVFTSHQEQQIVSRLQYLENRGFPLTVDGLLQLAYEYAVKLNRKNELNAKLPLNWISNKKCSRDWWFSFKRRHPTLSIRTPEGLSISRANAFNRQRVASFFDQLKHIYEENHLIDFPQLIYNIDETGLSTVPNNARRVIATKGARVVQSIQVGERGTLTTIIPAISASGECLPPFVILKGKKPSDEIVEGLSKQDITVVSTKSGYIDSQVFLEFLDHFQKYRTKIYGKKCILVLDGHTSHLTIEAITYAISHNIELVCLPPHSSHRLQPLDTHFNKSLKSVWSNSVAEFLRISSSSSLTRRDFFELFIPVWEEMKQKRGLIVNSFAHCGLYPLNKQVVHDKEFSKSESFVSIDQTSPSTSFKKDDSSSSINHPHHLIRSIFKSPQKKANLTHTKPHIASGLKKLQTKDKTFKVKLSFHRTTQPTAMPFPSTCVGENMNSFEKIKPQKKKSCLCCVCGDDYYAASSTKEDWLKCPHCQLWACEICFGIDCCYNCEDD